MRTSTLIGYKAASDLAGKLSFFAIVVLAAPIARYTEATARQLLERSAYIRAVLETAPAPPAWDPRDGMKKIK